MAARRLGEPSAKGFDPDTGQVYMERTCKAGSMTPDWTWKTPRRLESSIERLNHAAPGSASLRDISIRTVLANLFNLSPGMMETLPLHLTRQLWLKIKSSQLDSLRTWKVFASLFAMQRSDRIENKRLVLSGSNMNITECIKHIDSPSFHFITFLNLSDFSCSRSDLIHLSRLANLGMLTISTRDPSWISLEDGIVRAWGRAASETGAFSRLRILVCRFQTYITAKSFVYLQDFPALDLVLLDQCRVSEGLTNQAAQQEWHAKEYSRLRSDAVDLPAWKDIYSGLLKKGALLDIEAMHKPFENDEDSEPILDVSQYMVISPKGSLQPQ
ncbi:MAG: hypothetical protein LQ339_006194 [Xanthoria mediterranea]|nr:MAG: hypothetical protein LQ339_006194 [Xanthoria mediterranea]